jgi:23S rRNA (guanine745-N1)-methyltransferase
MDFNVELLICPHCRTRFSASDGMITCASQHTFDIAREGYISLSRSPQSGDTAEMLRARRRFLTRGHLRPLADALGGLAEAYFAGAGSQPAAILDAGCGEGYYLRALKDHLGCQAAGSIFSGLDCSKAAVRMAAKRMRAAQGANSCFVVADLRSQIPYRDHCIQLLFSVFAPRNGREFARVVTASGLLLVAIPTPQHLAEPRAALGLLDVEVNKHQRVIERLAPWFALVETHELHSSVRLEREDLVDLVTMTPNYWHRAQVRWDSLAGIAGEYATIGVMILAFRRRIGD